MLAAAQAASTLHAQSPFASRVVEYAPAPGQNQGNAAFNNPARALGAPVGGGVNAADNTKVVTLGGFGGSITLGFDHPIPDSPPTASNPAGADLIIFGNAFWAGGNPDVRWAEPGVIEVSRDANGNGLADDAWFVIPGSHLPTAPQDAWATIELSGGIVRSGFLLDGLPFGGGAPIIINPLDGGVQGVRGYADCSPTMALGDFDGDGEPDRDGADPDWFYTVPGDPARTGVPAFSGGGDAVDIADAVTPAGLPAGLTAVDFVRITTGVHRTSNVFGETSTEVGGVAQVRARRLADVGTQGGLVGPDGVLDNNDFVAFIDQFFRSSPLADAGRQGGLPGADGVFDNNDFVVFIGWFFSGE